MFAVSTFATVRVIEVNKSGKPADSTVTFQFRDGDVGDFGPGVVLMATFSPPPANFSEGYPRQHGLNTDNVLQNAARGFRITEAFYFVEEKWRALRDSNSGPSGL